MYLCARMHARAAEGEGDGKHERPRMRCFLKAWLGTCRKHASWERAFATCARASPALSAERSSKTILVSVSYCVQLTAITWTGMNRTYVTFPVKATAGLTVRSWVIQEAKVYSHFLKDEYRGGGKRKKATSWWLTFTSIVLIHLQVDDFEIFFLFSDISEFNQRTTSGFLALRWSYTGQKHPHLQQLVVKSWKVIWSAY